MNLNVMFAKWRVAAETGTARSGSGTKYRPGTLSNYISSFERVWLPPFGKSPTDALNRSKVQHVVDKMIADGLAPQTIKNHVTALRAVYRWAVRREYADLNPANDIELPFGGTKRDRVVSPEQAWAMVRRLPTPTDQALWGLAFFTGLRRGELQGLRWEDIDLDARTLTVTQAYDAVSRTFGPPKTEAGARTLMFPRRLVLLLGRLPSREGLVIPGAGEGPFNASARAAVARGAWEAAGYEALTFHECRHTYASMLIAAKLNIKTVQTWMGHASITITMDRYGHLMPGQGDAAIEQLENYLEHEMHKAAHKKFADDVYANQDRAIGEAIGAWRDGE